MSVQALSPFSGAKRLFEEEHPEDTESPCDRGQHKRGRFVAGSPSGRCSGAAAAAAAFGPVHPSTLNALRALFPGMDDQVRVLNDAWEVGVCRGCVSNDWWRRNDAWRCAPRRRRRCVRARAQRGGGDGALVAPRARSGDRCCRLISAPTFLSTSATSSKHNRR